MGMPMELNTMIVTKNKEIRLKSSNLYTLTKEGYRLYPLDIPLEIRKTKETKPVAIAKINEMTWKNGQTELTYELLDLNTVN
ncbi:DUF2584 domain-containing protein [Fictibacillus enclensis]|uniref:DUF2584 domain-containing protein n=1 Tax=Fictibacillus fluitans TaxID=3058422 RepID=A0ABT8HS76_9BACL|nr:MULTISPECIES: DUF2584 domain-containing protein [Fictibacillus]MDM5199158.1 DUF2584 domain-containing protein [Fictibacillus enclensis]MDM5338339.1 DUF2584 domain-containing protein [Fictibacillus enclensis]MDN4523142.1 DUF2584 domain-containing protein [Fictibacillus sp. NE201]WHY74709.1 DUF2584 domain-containing protein [Fictibacillus enclensis]